MSSAVRHATRADVPAMAWIVAAWERGAEWNPDNAPIQEITGAIEAAFDAREIWVVGDPVEGYISIDPSRDHIGGFYVSRPGQGMGKRLLDRAKAGRARLTLNTHKPNTDAHRFYAREGFVVTGEEAGSSGGVRELVMEWAA